MSRLIIYCTDISQLKYIYCVSLLFHGTFGKKAEDLDNLLVQEAGFSFPRHVADFKMTQNEFLNICNQKTL